MKKITSILLAAGVLSLSACSDFGVTKQAMDNVDHSAAQNEAQLRKISPEVMAGQDSVQVDNGVYLGAKPIEIVSKTELPDIFYHDLTIDRSVRSVSEIGERITLLTGIPVKVSRDALTASGLGTSGGGSTASSSGGNPIGPPPISSASSQGNNNSSASAKFEASGPLYSVLDTITARFNLSWRYRDGNIEIFHLDTRTFTIFAIPGTSSLKASVNSGDSSSSNSSGSSGGGSGGSSGNSNGTTTASTQTTSVESNALSVWGDISSTVNSMLSSYGKAFVSPATGSVTVTDTPQVLRTVENYITSRNKALTRQVMINVKVISVDLTKNDQYGINWNLVFKTLSNRWGLNLANNFPITDASASTLSAAVLATQGTLGQFNGTDEVIQAISSQGKVDLKHSASVTTLNNQPVPVQVAKQTTYLASVTTSSVANAGVQTQLTPGVVTTGFNMNLLPHVLDDGTVLLQFAIDVSVLDSLNTVSSGGQSIQTPTIDTRNFLQRVSMRSGETLILSGFEEGSDNANTQGPISPNNFLLGGGVNSTSGKTSIVVMITPVITEAGK